MGATAAMVDRLCLMEGLRWTCIVLTEMKKRGIKSRAASIALENQSWRRWIDKQNRPKLIVAYAPADTRLQTSKIRDFFGLTFSWIVINVGGIFQMVDSSKCFSHNQNCSMYNSTLCIWWYGRYSFDS